MYPIQYINREAMEHMMKKNYKKIDNFKASYTLFAIFTLMSFMFQGVPECFKYIGIIGTAIAIVVDKKLCGETKDIYRIQRGLNDFLDYQYSDMVVEFEIKEKGLNYRYRDLKKSIANPNSQEYQYNGRGIPLTVIKKEDTDCITIDCKKLELIVPENYEWKIETIDAKNKKKE